MRVPGRWSPIRRRRFEPKTIAGVSACITLPLFLWLSYSRWNQRSTSFPDPTAPNLFFYSVEVTKLESPMASSRQVRIKRVPLGMTIWGVRGENKAGRVHTATGAPSGRPSLALSSSNLAWSTAQPPSGSRSAPHRIAIAASAFMTVSPSAPVGRESHPSASSASVTGNPAVFMRFGGTTGRGSRGAR